MLVGIAEENVMPHIPDITTTLQGALDALRNRRWD